MRLARRLIQSSENGFSSSDFKDIVIKHILVTKYCITLEEN